MLEPIPYKRLKVEELLLLEVYRFPEEDFHLQVEFRLLVAWLLVAQMSMCSIWTI